MFTIACYVPLFLAWLTNTDSRIIYKIHFNIILPSMPTSSKWYLFFRLTHETTDFSSPIHFKCLAHVISLWFDPPNIWWAVKTANLFIMQFPLLDSIMLQNFTQSLCVKIRFSKLFITSQINPTLRSALFWNITLRRLVISYRRFGKTCRSHLQGSRSPRREKITDKPNL